MRSFINCFSSRPQVLLKFHGVRSTGGNSIQRRAIPLTVIDTVRKSTFLSVFTE